ncbi:transgelin [Plakobranchus ocellatus]|uniref:Transgelin n=1 Tax=Plakobranchus ocellatus TaxID=259542 RepID=A0AAV3ZF75_9GAST|nr:transgelin [Plakobranchus ocellatus]
MANKGPSYGLSLECKIKIERKFDIQRARDVLGWMEATIGRKLHPDVSSLTSEQEMADILKDGSALCELMNVISPGAIKFRPAKKAKLAFQQMENIELFTKACAEYGLNPLDVFQVPDLYETKAMFTAQKKGFQGPRCGVKLAEKNERNFSLEQITEGKKIIPMQAGSNLNPSQSGMTPYGQGRQIVASDYQGKELSSSANQSVIGLQYGTNRLASQSGMTPYGLGRQILLSSGSGSDRSASQKETGNKTGKRCDSENVGDGANNVHTTEGFHEATQAIGEVNGTFEDEVLAGENNKNLT